MAEDDYAINTVCVVTDYMNYKIQKSGFAWQVSPTRNSPNNKVMLTVRSMCKEFEDRYEQHFEEMCRTCADIEMNADSYMSILEELTDGELNWGRVIAIFAFAGALAVYRLRKGEEKDVDMIREWTCSFMHKNVDDWVARNNGWVGILVHFRTKYITLQQNYSLYLLYLL